MNAAWQSLLELLGAKVIVLSFFCGLCYKLWNSFGNPFFLAEHQATEDSKQALHLDLSRLEQQLAEKVELAHASNKRLTEIEKSFSLWQEKIRSQLQHDRDAQQQQNAVYIHRLEHKYKTVKEYENARETLEIATTQARRSLVESHATTHGKKALETAISKIATATKVPFA